MMSSLRARLTVAAWGIPLLLGITYIGGWWLAVLIGAISLLGLREYYALHRLQGAHPIEWLGMIIGGGIIFLWYLTDVKGLSWGILGGTLITGIGNLRHRANHRDFMVTMGGVVYIPLLAGSFLAVRNYGMGFSEEGKWLALGLWLSLWIGDTAAYGIGARWGRHPLASSISPRKTVEGFGAGVLASGIVALGGYFLHLVDWINATMLALSAGVVGQLGDLVESQIKREMGVKDSSQFLPGHGGILDRFDSFLFAAPLLGSFLLGRSYGGW